MPKQYPNEIRSRAVRLVVEHRGEYETEYEAIRSVAAKLGIGSAETLRKWLRQAEVDDGARPGVSTEESAELRRLRLENKELRRANEILKAASAFFAAELDRPTSRS
jgi:transposase